MADESVRSLIAALGFEVDTTGADQFEARFKKLESTVGALATKLDKFKPKFDGKKGEEAGRKFGKRIKKGIKEGLKIDEEKGLPGFSASLKKGLGKALKVAKVAAIAGVAAIAAAIGKGFFKFTDVESAKFALRFQAENLGVDFDKIIDKLDKVREKTGDVVDELDVLQALKVGFALTGNFENVAENMEKVIKFASVLGEDLSDVQRQFSTFILTGGNLAELKKFGFFEQAQIEALKRAGTGFGPVAERTRTKILDEKIAEQLGRLNKAFIDFGETNAAFIARMKSLISGGVIGLGEEATTRAKKIVDSESVLGLVKGGIDETIGEFKNDFKRFFNFIGATGDSVGERLSPRDLLKRQIEKLEARAEARETTRINQNNTININGGDIQEVKKVVGEVIKDAAQIELRKTPQIGIPNNNPISQDVIP